MKIEITPEEKHMIETALLNQSLRETEISVNLNVPNTVGRSYKNLYFKIHAPIAPVKTIWNDDGTNGPVLICPP